jgi:transcriptional regulator with XRE-family HTH domain
MTAEQIKALRERLHLARRDLAKALGVDPADVAAWESGERFPTRKHVASMGELDGAGAPRASPDRGADLGAYAVLADPLVWAIVRKLLAHPELREKAAELAARYPDPHAGA